MRFQKLVWFKQVHLRRSCFIKKVNFQLQWLMTSEVKLQICCSLFPKCHSSWSALHCNMYLHHLSCCITECTGAAFLILFVLGSGLGLTLLPPPPGTQPWSQRTRARDGASVAEFSTNQSPAAGGLTNHRREAAALHLRLPSTRKTNCDKGLSSFDL